MEKMEFSGKQRAEAMQYRWTKRADVWKTEALVLILLTAFTFVINRHMEIKGLYMDDLYQWFCFNVYQRRDTFPCPLQSGGMDRNETFRHPCKLVCAL